MSVADPILLPALVADIGGTNARFALVGEDGVLRGAQSFAHGGYPEIEDALRERVLPAFDEAPQSAFFAVAGAVEGECIPLTNSPWSLTPRQLMQAFDFRQVALFNDFEALALALPELGADDFVVVTEGEPEGHAPLVVIGPGTGLGVGALFPANGQWVPVATEGGHRGFGPESPDEVELWQAMWRTESARVSAETVLSGRGIARLYAALAGLAGAEVSLTTPAAVSSAGLAGTDPIAVEALDIFMRNLGRFAADCTLLFRAGGVYLAGGVSLHLARLFHGEAFRSAFTSRDPYEEQLARLPVRLITHPTAALLGVAAYVRTPERFLIDRAGRWWS